MQEEPQGDLALAEPAVCGYRPSSWAAAVCRYCRSTGHLKLVCLYDSRGEVQRRFPFGNVLSRALLTLTLSGSSAPIDDRHRDLGGSLRHLVPYCPWYLWELGPFRASPGG